jgi:hypothetical protein
MSTAKDSVVLAPTPSARPQLVPYQSAPLPFDPVLIAAGVRVAVLSIVRRTLGWKRYPGGVEAICRAVIDDCWTGQFFAGSAGHFHQFWTRDLAMCTGALCRLGYREKVLKSWTWALATFARARRLTTTIFARRYPRDVYSFACDSLPMLLFGLEQVGAHDLALQYRDFLAVEVERYVASVFDPESGLARGDRYFSAPRDCITGRSTVFANTMLALLERLLDHQDVLPNPLHGSNVASRIRENFWRGDYFRDALDRDEPSGDANIWPFFFNVVTDPEMKRRALASLDRLGFTKPVPLRYFQHRLPESELIIPRLFAPNYQGDTSWMQIGPVYLGLLRDVDGDSFSSHRRAVAAVVERDQNFLELYTSAGRPYRGRAGLYFADQGMLWAALFLDLL